MQPYRRALGWWRLIQDRLSNRGDTEHEQALIRIAIVGLLLVYALLVPIEPQPPAIIWTPTVAQLGFIILPLSILHFAWIVADPAVRYVRRASWMVIDHAGTVLAMAVGGEQMALLYPLLLWMTLGHGFRYGPKYLVGSSLISVTLFAPLVLHHPVWQAKGAFGVGLILGLILIPGYCFRLLRHLHDARHRAEASSEAKSRFLATVSHELRTPLHAILGMTELLRGTPLQPEQRDMARTIHTAGHGLLNMIEDILDIARIEAGAAPDEADRFDVQKLLHGIRDMLGYRAATKGLPLRLRLDADLVAELHGPRRSIEQILINLVTNAIKFTDSGEVRVEAALEEVTGEHAVLRLSVSDTGCGIPEAARSRVFERFTQVDETTTRRHGGSGLGLAIVKRLVEHDGGTIKLTSALGSGTRFDVHLPVRVVGDLAAAPSGIVLVHGTPSNQQRRTLETSGLRFHPAPTRRAAFVSAQSVDLWCPNGPSDVSEPPRHGRDLLVWSDAAQPPDALVCLPVNCGPATLRRAVRAALVTADETVIAEDDNRVHAADVSLDILVADDHDINRQVIQRLLARGGHRTALADSAEAALEYLEQAIVDVVVLDLNMPGIGGMAAAKELKERRPRPKLVALTADATVGTREACLAAGFDTFLTKPVDGGRLLEAVQVTSEERRRSAIAVVPTEEPSEEPAAEVIDRRRLAMLYELEDGDGFVDEMIDGFVSDGRDLVAEIKAAAVAGDVQRFRDAAHALRSAATHLGATGVFERCLAVKTLHEDVLRAEAVAIGRRVDEAFTAASEALLSTRGTPSPGARRATGDMISSPSA